MDRNVIIAKLDELERYVSELQEIVPADFNQYQKTTIRRACERLLQLCIECTIDICKKLVIGERLGLPRDEVDVFEKVRKANVLSDKTLAVLKTMRGLRNILVHEYADINDVRVFEIIIGSLNDFERFKNEIQNYLLKEK